MLPSPEVKLGVPEESAKPNSNLSVPSLQRPRRPSKPRAPVWKDSVYINQFHVSHSKATSDNSETFSEVEAQTIQLSQSIPESSPQIPQLGNNYHATPSSADLKKLEEAGMPRSDSSASAVKSRRVQIPDIKHRMSKIGSRINDVLKRNSIDAGSILVDRKFSMALSLAPEPVQHKRIAAPVPPIPSFLTLLPESVSRKILLMLNHEDLARCSLVCLSWYNLVSSNDLWSELCIKRNWLHASAALNESMLAAEKGMEGSDEMAFNWKAVYCSYHLSEKNWGHLKFHQMEIGEAEWVERKENIHEPDVEAYDENVDSTSIIEAKSALPQEKVIKTLVTKPCHLESIYALAMDRDHIITGSKDGLMKVWRLGKDICKQVTIKIPDSPLSFSTLNNVRVYSVDFTGSFAFAGLSDGSIVIYNLNDGSLIGRLHHEHRDAITALKIVTLESLANLSRKSRTSTMSLTKTFAVMVTTSFDGQCRVYELRKAEGNFPSTVFSNSDIKKEKIKHDRFFFKKARLLVRLISVYTEHTHDVYCLALHSKGTEARQQMPVKSKRLMQNRGTITAYTGGADKTIRCWNIRESQTVLELTGHEDTVTAISCCHLLVSGSLDKTIRVWDRNDGVCLHVLDDHQSWVKSLLLQQSAHCEVLRLVSSGWDGLVRVFELDMTNGQVLSRKKLDTDISSSDKESLVVMSLAFDIFGLVVGFRDGRLFRFSFEQII